jgi:hypothetical protein
MVAPVRTYFPPRPRALPVPHIMPAWIARAEIRRLLRKATYERKIGRNPYIPGTLGFWARIETFRWFGYLFRA